MGANASEYLTQIVHAISRQPDEILDRVDSPTAAMLEKTVQNAVALSVQRTGKVEAEDSMGYPLGYFQPTEGCFANDLFEFSTDLPLEFRESS